MKFPFKKVGDTFSVDEYNAMCYLLSKQKYEEDILLELKAKHYVYGVYKLSDPKNILVTKNGGFIIRKDNLPFTITFAHQNPSANFYIELKFAKQKEVTQNGITTILYPYDIIDQLDDTLPDSAYDISYETVTIKLDRVDSNTSKIEIVPADYGINTGDYISYNAKAIMKYDEPVINFEDGRAVDTEQIICNDFNDMQRAIISAPEGSAVHLRLHGATTYSFTDKLNIDFKKKVYIEGGNVSSNSYSILDGHDTYRLFQVNPDSLLSIKNCKLYRGNANVVHGNSDINKTGGAINMGSKYENEGDMDGLHVSYVNVDTCIFENCKAERGGAIYNMRGKLNVDNCQFINCRATSDTNQAGAFGGAILNQSINLYNGSSNQIVIDKSKYYYNQNNNTSYILFNVKTTQNINYFINNDFTLNNYILNYNNNKYNCISNKLNNNQYLYNIELPIKIPVGKTFYFTFQSFNQQPSLCTRLLKVTGNQNTQLYVEMV